ncbi:MAG TPA: transcription elongation factor GreA [Candidatus Fraserbacteria bacterium]|nr:transcription elongation factor GreA [Candidatus Fraserbacteria bacterium]
METLVEVVLTREGYQLKTRELEEYRRILHEEIPQRIKAAKDHGGELRENKEFLDIQTEKEFYEAEVRQLEELLDHAKIIDEASISTKTVSLGSRVTIKELKSNEQMTLELVGQAEVNLEENKISTDSPLGKALLGRRRGDEFELDAPAGTRRYRVLGIQRPRG